MAIIQVNFVSQTLWRTVPFQVILPVDKLTPDGRLPEPKKYKTLYLLHGLLGNYTDWVSGTRIQRWAEERDLAVVMPSGDNAFYVDRPDSHNRYGEFVGKELVEITRRMFPLSDKREDTCIGGLSMGGFGAMRNGLKYHETFGAIVSLSGAFGMFEDLADPDVPKVGLLEPAFHESLFGPSETAIVSDKNPRVLIEELGKQKKADPTLPLPQIYMACGTEDDLVKHNRTFKKLLSENGFSVTYEEGPGSHSWDFWDTYIKKAIDWLPLDEQSAGLNSGNVHVDEMLDDGGPI